MKHTVMIVEDDVDASETLREFLQEEGYEVVCATDGARALAAAEGVDHLCLVFLDLYMPGMNGWDFFAAFKAQPRFSRVPVAVVTSAPDRAPEGAERVLPKPVALTSVLATAAEHCPF